MVDVAKRPTGVTTVCVHNVHTKPICFAWQLSQGLKLGRSLFVRAVVRKATTSLSFLNFLQPSISNLEKGIVEVLNFLSLFVYRQNQFLLCSFQSVSRVTIVLCCKALIDKRLLLLSETRDDSVLCDVSSPDNIPRCFMFFFSQKCA